MKDPGRRGLLIYCPAASGGIAEHAHYQASALHGLGIPVEMVAATDYLAGREVRYPIARILPPAPSGKPGTVRRIRHAAWLVATPWRLAAYLWRKRPDAVLLASYSEYLSPAWIWPHLALRRFLRLRYGANLHDPVRDFQLGPRWWHRLSVALSYRVLDFVIVHAALPRTDIVPNHVVVHEAPFGVFEISAPDRGSATENPLPSFPRGAPMLLCFGHIRDNKNIDLLIRALASFPDLHLVIAGPAPTSGQRPLEKYAEIARETNAAERVHFASGFIADEEVGLYFRRASWIAVTYSATFHSQSAVLSVAVRARKQVLASSGESPMRAAVEGFGLGVFVEPDSVPAVVGGLRRLMDNPPEPDWAGYEAHASWVTNAKVVAAASGISAGEQRE